MAEPQLIDYIKKARDAGQADDQTRSLLYKNGWTEAEVNDAFASFNNPQPEIIRPQSQPAAQLKISSQPKIQSQTQAQPQYQSPKMGPREDISHMKVHSHLLSKILISLIILVVLGGVAIAASQYLGFSFNLFQAPNPATVINKMLTNMAGVKSSHTTIQVDIKATDITSKAVQGEMVLNTNSETDITDIKNPKAGGNFTFNLILPEFSSPAALATVSMNVVGGAAYFKINDITVPSSSSATYSGLNIPQLKGKWFRVDQDSVKALSRVQNSQVSAPDISKINNSAFYKEIQNLVAQENMFSDVKQLNDQTISGQNTYHYSITISKIKLEDLANKLITTSIQQSGNSSPLIVNLAQAAAKTFLDSIGDVNLEMWIGQSDYMLYQVKLDKVIDLSKIVQAYGAGSLINANNMQLEVKLNITNSNFNKAITVQAPEGAQKIEDIVLPLLKTQKINNDMKQIGFTAQSLYFANKSYSSLCNRGLLNGYLGVYGKTLIDLNNDIINQNDNRNPAKKPSCFANVQNYCVSTQLADGSYLCIGNTGKVGKTQCASEITVCQ